MENFRSLDLGWALHRRRLGSFGLGMHPLRVEFVLICADVEKGSAWP